MKECTRCHRLVLDTQAACPLDDAPLEPSEADPPIGVGRVLGNYQLVALIGEGGMGNIYVGAHTRINRHVAIKVVRDEIAFRKDALARFFDESRTIGRLHHPNIVEQIDMVEDVVDGAYCVLELLRGEDLKTRIASGALPTASVLHIGAQIADALSAVHALDIVHRDLKPENLIILKDDIVKLIDFGVAQVADAGATNLIGTAAYMAPEQAAGKRVDGRADLYALGVVLFEMATGRHPYPSGTDAEYILAHAHDPIPRPHLTKALANVIVRCLAKRPEQRFASAADVAAALRDIEPRAGEGRGWTWAAAAALVASAGAVLYVTAPWQSAPDPVVHAAPAPRPAPVPARPPDAPPPPAAKVVEQPPATVTLAFTSNPPGASVVREGETIALGTTPFDTTLPAAEKAFRVTFVRDGYQPKSVEVELGSAHEVSAELAPLRAVAVHPSQPAHKKKVQREGVMDPFQK